jgi:hypothetical protein
MKQGTVKYSEEFVTPIGLKKWFGVELQYDMDTEDPPFDKAKMIVAMAAGVQISFNESLPLGPPIGLPVIDKAEERLGIKIDNASTMDDLLKYKNDLSTPYLSDLFAAKLTALK